MVVTCKYENKFKGINSRLDEIQAAVLKVKLKYLDEYNNRRIEIANHYHNNINNSKVILPKLKTMVILVVYHLFVLRTKNRNEFASFLRNKGIDTLIHYPIAPHKQLAYKEWAEDNYPISEKIHDEVLSIPNGPYLSDDQIYEVIDAINKY